eukprot:8939713-Ditylum_brightwellii.AAC.1
MSIVASAIHINPYGQTLENTIFNTEKMGPRKDHSCSCRQSHPLSISQNPYLPPHQVPSKQVDVVCPAGEVVGLLGGDQFVQPVKLRVYLLQELTQHLLPQQLLLLLCFAGSLAYTDGIPHIHGLFRYPS